MPLRIQRTWLFAIGACLAIMAMPQATHAALYNASHVIGQLDFISALSPTTQSSLITPIAATFDPVAKRLFVVDQLGMRVMVFDAATSTIANGENAMNVLGQASFTSSSAATTQSGFSFPSDAAYDPNANRLLVADRNNSRIMVFDAATSTIANGENALNVLGQANFTSSTASTTQHGLSFPFNDAFDPATNRLFVVDRSNNRVLVFDAATSTITNGENALNVLGQTNFTSSTGATAQNRLSSPDGVVFDAATNRLFVVDQSNHRVMVFDAATSTIANGENAINVLGQTSFTSSSAATSQSGLSFPNGIVLDPITNRLFVVDQGNNRVMVFDAATSTIANGENALNVLGQTDFTSSVAATTPTQSGFFSPASAGLDSTTNRLFVADKSNSRILQFSFIMITTGSLANGTAGTAYSATINTTSSQGNLNFFVVTGSLPSGLSLNASSGVISGTPSSAGTNIFTIEADDTTSTGMFYSQASYTVTIAPDPLAAAASQSSGSSMIGVGNGGASSAFSTITSIRPLSGAALSGIAAITAAFSSPTPISSAWFTLDGVRIGDMTTSSPAQASFDTRAFADGRHVISIYLQNYRGDTTISPRVPVTILNIGSTTSTSPVIATTSPVIPPPPPPPPASSPEFSFPKNLGLWDRGYDVGVLQVYLTSHASGPFGLQLKARGITGVFGPMTYRALHEFQASVGIRATGYLGPITRAYLNQ